MSGGWGGNRRADRLILKYVPVNFTPDAAAGGVSSADMLAAVIAGIDDALGGSGGGLQGVKSLLIESASFVFAGSTSTYTLPESITTDAAYLEFNLLAKSGVLVMENVGVSTTPTARGEYRVDGSTLEIYGDVTGDGDTYWIQYAIA